MGINGVKLTKCGKMQRCEKYHYASDTLFEYFQKQPPKVFCKKAVIRNFAKFTGKNKVPGLKCFPVNFAKFLKTPFLQNTYDDCF